MFAAIARKLSALSRRWARRHGLDASPCTLRARRIYILPTGLGLAYGLMLLAMLAGAMNYANNLALGLALLLGSLGLTAMHHCHRNLHGLVVRAAGADPVFAGQTARFRIILENTASTPRAELVVENEHHTSTPLQLPAGSSVETQLQIPAIHRGRLPLDQFRISTFHPLGLFRAWVYLQMDSHCIVYPRQAADNDLLPITPMPASGERHGIPGEEEFAGLRPYQPGDSPRRIDWKAYAREQGLQVKQHAGAQTQPELLDFDALTGMDTEARLSQLCRWVEDANSQDRRYALKLPGVNIAIGSGAAHRQRCLTALALFGL